MSRNRAVTIHCVSPALLQKVIGQRTPHGNFLTQESRKWVAVDNSTGDAWTEEFSRKWQAICWLLGKYELRGRNQL